MSVPQSPLVAMTPRTPGTPYPIAQSTQAVNDLLMMMKGTLNTLGSTFDSLGEQSAKVATLGPALDSAHQIHQLRRQMRIQEKHQTARIDDIKYLVQDQLKIQIAEHMREQIAQQIKAEIAKQVGEQVQKQITTHLPVPLAIQASESQKQLSEVRVSLKNTEARRHNSHLRQTNLDEHLSVMLRPDGTPSEHFPQSLRAVLSYEPDIIRDLVEDYGLVVDKIREINLNRFMSFCGVPFHLIPPHVNSRMIGNALGLSS